MPLTFTSPLIIAKLEWDTANTSHIAKHGLSQVEVEEACKRIVTVTQTRKFRLLVTGQLPDARLVSVVLAPKGDGIYYPVSARSASRKERRLIKEGGED